MASRNGLTATVKVLVEAGADTETKAEVREIESDIHMWLSGNNG
jgi:hypothetical protein